VTDAKETIVMGKMPLLAEFALLREGARMPTRANDLAIGWDLYAFAADRGGRHFQLSPHSVTKIPTGIAVKPPLGYYFQLCSRSGWGSKGFFVANAPGIIDPDYQEEIFVLFYNGTSRPEYVSHENRIGQLVLAPIVPFAWVEAAPWTTSRKGFGSTGK